MSVVPLFLSGEVSPPAVCNACDTAALCLWRRHTANALLICPLLPAANWWAPLCMLCVCVSVYVVALSSMIVMCLSCVVSIPIPLFCFAALPTDSHTHTHTHHVQRCLPSLQKYPRPSPGTRPPTHLTSPSPSPAASRRQGERRSSPSFSLPPLPPRTRTV